MVKDLECSKTPPPMGFPRQICGRLFFLLLFISIFGFAAWGQRLGNEGATKADVCAEADQALKAGLWESAHRGYVECLTRDAKNLEALSNLGVTLTRLGRTDDAIQTYRKALAVNPNNPNVHLNLALALIKGDKYESAIDQLLPLQKQDPDNYQVTELLAFCYFHLQRYSLAAREAERVQRARPDDGANALILGSAYTRMGLYQKAVPLIALAMKSAGSADGHLIMAQAFLGLRLYRSARDELSQAAALQPDLPGLHSAMGMAKVGLGDSEGSIADFAEALRTDPTDYEANYYMGRLERLEGDPGTAREYLTKALNSRPESAEVLFEFAALAVAERNYLKAEPLLNTIIRQHPDHAEAHFLLSQLYRKTGRVDSARREQMTFEKLRRQREESSQRKGQGVPPREESSSTPGGPSQR
jgi:tetratricopeptide (TPR) repeat protein